MELIREIIPGLDNDMHKGQAGRIGIIGGSKEYTGAPFFAAMSALRTGADLVYVFCSAEASIPIKSYSPELIVYPVLDEPHAVSFVSSLLPKLHSLVIGPGLGRNVQHKNVIEGVVKAARQSNIPMVFDADGLDFVCKDLNLVRGYDKAILTPNAMEFERLFESCFDTTILDIEKKIGEVSRELQVTVLRKGVTDIIHDGSILIHSKEEGSARRCGGQGDILSGSLGVASFWAQQQFKNKDFADNSFLTPMVIAGLFASILTRRANRIAFSSKGRSMITSDMLNTIGASLNSIINDSDV